MEHILWRLFLESRNVDMLNLKRLYEILRKEPMINAQGLVIEFEICKIGPNF